MAAERAAEILRGALRGSVLVIVLAAAARWSDPGPVDVAVIGSAAVLLALRARTLGRRFAAVPTAGAAVTAVIAVMVATIGVPVDRLLVTLAGVVAVLGALLVMTEHRGPPSPAGTAVAARLARWIECTVIVLVIPLASGAVAGLIQVAATR